MRRESDGSIRTDGKVLILGERLEHSQGTK